MPKIDIQNAPEVFVGEERFIPFITEEQIQARCRELGEIITEDYADKLPIFIGVLNGSSIFMSDLIRWVALDCEIDFLRLSSYGDQKISSGKVKMLKDFACEIQGRDIVVVEDIVDTGLSISYMKKLIADHKPASIRFVSLLIKPNSLKYDVKIDYIGFEIPDKFVIGYGLDYAQKYRNLRSIYMLAETK